MLLPILAGPFLTCVWSRCWMCHVLQCPQARQYRQSQSTTCRRHLSLCHPDSRLRRHAPAAYRARSMVRLGRVGQARQWIFRRSRQYLLRPRAKARRMLRMIKKKERRGRATALRNYTSGLLYLAGEASLLRLCLAPQSQRCPSLPLRLHPSRP